MTVCRTAGRGRGGGRGGGGGFQREGRGKEEEEAEEEGLLVDTVYNTHKWGGATHPEAWPGGGQKPGAASNIPLSSSTSVKHAWARRKIAYTVKEENPRLQKDLDVRAQISLLRELKLRRAIDDMKEKILTLVDLRPAHEKSTWKSTERRPAGGTVCFFVLSIRHRFNKVPGAHRGTTWTRTLAMPFYLRP